MAPVERIHKKKDRGYQDQDPRVRIRIKNQNQILGGSSRRKWRSRRRRRSGGCKQRRLARVRAKFNLLRSVDAVQVARVARVRMASVSGTDQHWRMMEGGGGRRRGSGTKMAAGISKKMEWRAKGFTVGKTARSRETDDEEWLVEMAQAWGRRGCE
ncbi:26S proteasome regulatory subunit RPN12 [Fusarium oxysporum f. sp. albedinis]|nr:26S proteasome regulatory subunit RPN12 [Fusarium oxysporum f. sp. albedinis]